MKEHFCFKSLRELHRVSVRRLLLHLTFNVSLGKLPSSATCFDSSYFILRLPTLSQWRPNIAWPILISAEFGVIRVRRDLTDGTHTKRTVVRHASRQLVRRIYGIARPRLEGVHIQDTIPILVAEDTTFESRSANEPPGNRTWAYNIGEREVIWRLGCAGSRNAAGRGGRERSS